MDKPTENRWYANQRVGDKTLGAIVPNLAKQFNFEGKFTTHSLRKTTATNLFRAGVPENLVMMQTRHQSADGVRAYMTPSLEQRLHVSSLLQPNSSSSNPIVSTQILATPTQSSNIVQHSSPSISHPVSISNPFSTWDGIGEMIDSIHQGLEDMEDDDELRRQQLHACEEKEEYAHKTRKGKSSNFFRKAGDDVQPNFVINIGSIHIHK